MVRNTFKTIAVFYILLVLFINHAGVVPFDTANVDTVNIVRTSDIKFLGNVSSGQVNATFRDLVTSGPTSISAEVFFNVFPGTTYMLNVINLMLELITFSVDVSGFPRVHFWLNAFIFITKILAVIGIAEFLPGIG